MVKTLVKPNKLIHSQAFILPTNDFIIALNLFENVLAFTEMLHVDTDKPNILSPDRLILIDYMFF